MTGLDQLKYQLGLVSIGLDQLISVWVSYYWSIYWFGLVIICLDWLILV